MFFVPSAQAGNLPAEPPVDLSPLPALDSLAQEATLDGKTASEWRQAAVHWRRRTLALKRVLVHRSSVSEAINLACAVYGNCSTLWRRARCESHLYQYARNPSGASGLFQFLPSTFSSTPFRGFSIWSPYANALAAGWMMGPAGRGGEWSCR